MKKNIKVLLVDDNQMITECISVYLEDEGFDVSIAESGESALELIRNTPPCICIVDLRLPGINGEQFIIAAHEIHPSIKFMIHTGSTYTLSKELQGFGITKNDILQKPIQKLAILSDLIIEKCTKGQPA